MEREIRKLICCFVALSVMGCSAQSEEKKYEFVGKEEISTVDFSQSSSIVGVKTESVSIQADAYGAPSKGVVSVSLENLGNQALIEDITNLSDIKNKEGEEEFLKTGDRLLWENLGKNIYYEGTSHEEYPFEVKVTYYLEGKESTVEEIAGKSGKVTIHFDYINKTQEKVRVDGVEVKAPIPYVMITTLILPDENFSDIELTHGKLLKMEGQNIAVLMAMPGMEEFLRLKNYEPTKEIELPDYTEVTMNAIDFELAFTATVVSTGVFEEIDLEDIHNGQEFSDSMNELQEAIDDLMEGTTELDEGVIEFSSAMNGYLDGVKSLSEGSEALNTGMQMIVEKKVDLVTGTQGIQFGLSQVQEGLEGLVSLLENDENRSQIEGAMNQCNTQIGMITTALGTIDTLIGDMETFESDANNQLESLSEIVNEIQALNVEAEAKGKAKEAIAESINNDNSIEDEEKSRLIEELNAKIEGSSLTSSLASKLTGLETRLSSMTTLNAPMLNQAVITDLELAMNTLESNLTFIDNFVQLKDSLSAIKETTSELATASSLLNQGMIALNAGLDQVASGITTLKNGASQLSQANGEIKEGMNTLKEGTEEFKNGVSEFKEESADDINDLAGDKLSDLLHKIKALKEIETRADNFSGRAVETESSVRYILETEEIKE